MTWAHWVAAPLIIAFTSCTISISLWVILAAWILLDFLADHIYWTVFAILAIPDDTVIFNFLFLGAFKLFLDWIQANLA